MNDHVDDTGVVSVVVLVASAGGMGALTAVLRALPVDLPVSVLVQQHLGGHGSALTMLLHKRTGREVVWATDGEELLAGRILVCPPLARMEVLPDGTVALFDHRTGALEHPHDALFASLADAVGARGVAVVLSGMGRDGAAGAAAVQAAGGFVISQDPDSAEYASMPTAAAPIAHLVLPLAEIGPMIANVVYGRPLPRPRSEIEATDWLFRGSGEVERLLRAVDWAATPLGPVSRWPEVLRAMVRTTLDSGYPMAVWWGPELIQIYNDRWRQFLGTTKHPRALAGRAAQTWPELWSFVGPMTQAVLTRGECAGGENMPMLMERDGLLEEVFATFTYSPITDASGTVVGVHNTALDTTATIVGERRMRTLRAVATATAQATSPQRACVLAAEALATEPADVPFALFYLLDHPRRQAQLAGAAGLAAGSAPAPHLMNLRSGDIAWPLPALLRDAAEGTAGKRAGLMIDDLTERFGGLLAPVPTPPGAHPPHSALHPPPQYPAWLWQRDRKPWAGRRCVVMTAAFTGGDGVERRRQHRRRTAPPSRTSPVRPPRPRTRPGRRG
ncbi:chemotaxis protein CheB [Planobispora siamensis]|uniref:protein-glutamate methylesterase n=1 Tax=Planobispora siamensis TaxID=936338 RepID=A0A8J3SNA7_9ACTN|nr:chemotaxis protein CheB [Planobispora siamensis]GIH95952.1 hypothetical protein Psi01_65820 [Planobispora siamensis]